VVPPSFAAKVPRPPMFNGFMPSMPTFIFSKPVQKGWVFKKQHRFTATTGSLRLFLYTVFIITFFEYSIIRKVL
jgi:hypothetical protein